MKKTSMLSLVVLLLFMNGSGRDHLGLKNSSLYFSVSKCTYGIKAHLDSVAFEVEKTLVKDFNIRLDSSTGRSTIKNYKAGDFRIHVWIDSNNPITLHIRVIENNKEIFLFQQRKSSGVKYIFYDKNSQPYLIETVLTTNQYSFGAGISRPPIVIKKDQT